MDRPEAPSALGAWDETVRRFAEEGRVGVSLDEVFAEVQANRARNDERFDRIIYELGEGKRRDEQMVMTIADAVQQTRRVEQELRSHEAWCRERAALAQGRAEGEKANKSDPAANAAKAAMVLEALSSTPGRMIFVAVGLAVAMLSGSETARAMFAALMPW